MSPRKRYRHAVGLAYVTVSLGPLAGSKKKLEESFLVDTGAIDCRVSAAKLRKIGIKTEGKDVYELADGTTVELPYASPGSRSSDPRP